MAYCDYLPAIFEQIEEYRCFGAAVDVMTDELLRRVESFCSELDLTAMTENLSHWEKLLSISSAGKTTEERQKAILSRLNIRLPYTREQLERQLSAVFPEGGWVVRQEGLSLMVGVSDKVSGFPIVLKKQLRQAIPANLSLNIYEIHFEDVAGHYQMYLQTADKLLIEERS